MKTLEKLVVLVAAGSILTFAEGCNSERAVSKPQPETVRVEVPVPSECKSDAHLALGGKYVDIPIVYCKDENEEELGCTSLYTNPRCYHLTEKKK